MTLNEHQKQALADLIDNKKIDILESLGHDAIQGTSIIYETNLEKLETKISTTILRGDEKALGSIMMQLFMNYNLCTINEKAQELKDEAEQEQADFHQKRAYELTKIHRDVRDFF